MFAVYFDQAYLEFQVMPTDEPIEGLAHFDLEDDAECYAAKLQRAYEPRIQAFLSGDETMIVN